jgi:hypothetical protein
VRVHFEYGGIQPGVLVLDLSAPMVRDAQARASRPPVTFYIAFDQFF